ncbi:MAG TPA: hypothetical protein VL442_04910 [Mucilaginibacter sp.]|nr:hypothetical protein [Mucilaginibacter sp.]
MRYLLLNSCFFILVSCSSVYKNLQPSVGDVSNLEKFRPDFNRALYKTEVDVVGHHLSGLLLIKTLPDSSVRMVFSNEVGFKFFDFEFKPDGEFKAYYVVKQMDKGPVIKTLKKDFELIMLRKKDIQVATVRQDDHSIYYIVKRPKGFFCYITDKAGTELERLEIASPRKPIVEAIMKNYINGIPDTIGITHKNFSFTIGLKRIDR